MERFSLFIDGVIISWGELTSSMLIVPCYEEVARGACFLSMNGNYFSDFLKLKRVDLVINWIMKKYFYCNFNHIVILSTYDIHE